MDIEKEFDITDPIDLQTVFRTQGPDGHMIEYRTEMPIMWDMIDTIQEYAYEDNWQKYRGPKFLVHLKGNLGTQLVLGNYHDFKRYLNIYKRYEFERFYGPDRDSND